MGRGVHGAARATQTFLLQLSLAWLLVTVSSDDIESRALYVTLSVLSMVCMAASFVSLHRVLTGWLGPRPGARAIRVMGVLMPLGYALMFFSYPLRVGWSNFLMAAMLLLLARATLGARRTVGRNWRILLFLCLGIMAVLTAGRGVMGAFVTTAYPTFLTPHPVNVAAALAINLVIVMGTVAVLVAWREEADQRLRNMANTDSLTGLLNRRGFMERAEALFANAVRYRSPLTVVMLDLDHFKTINDQRGHEGGDKALQLFARVVRESRRAGDLVGRLGGEEFCVLLPGGPPNAAAGFDERLRRTLRDAVGSELGFALDYSAGAAHLGGDDATLAALMGRADAALYEAKRGGRGHMHGGVPDGRATAA
jgi:diguanylate cyclase